MPMPRRVDFNQREITTYLRSQGATVLILSAVGRGCPDLLVGLNKRNVLVEVKDGAKPLSAQKLTPDQLRFHSIWQGEIIILRGLADARNLIWTMRSPVKCEHE